MPTQVRYTDAEVEQIKTLFPDTDSLKLYRRYLLDLPLSHDEIDRIQATWATPGARATVIKTTVPLTDGSEPIAVGYDLMNNINLAEQNFEYQVRRTGLFVKAIRYLTKRIEGFDTLPESCTGTGKWLTASVLEKTDDTDNTLTEVVLEQLVIKQNVEGLLLGLQGIINTPIETPEGKAARETADSTS